MLETDFQVVCFISETPLMSACKHLSDKSGCIVDLLVAHGADVFWTDHRTRSGNTFPHSTAICVFQEEKEENTVANSVLSFECHEDSMCQVIQFPPPPPPKFL